MEVIHARCAGLDVHKKTVAACVRVAAGAAVRHEVRTFGTTTGELETLGAWLRAEGCTPAVLESTGVYWPIYWRTAWCGRASCRRQVSRRCGS